MDSFSYDASGKISLDHIYNRSDPRAYFTTLRRLDYRVPEAARPAFQALFSARRQERSQEAVKVVDVGCSYGVNAALLKHGMQMSDLYSLYGAEAPETYSELVARDRRLFADPADDTLSFVGVDAADKAIAYAVDAGVLDAGVAADLETAEPGRRDAETVGAADMIISTGCVGYVTEASLDRLAQQSLDQDVWMAHCVLRMFDYGPISDLMDGYGYKTEKLEGVVFPQRRFASAEERDHVRDNLDRLGIDADGIEASGWYAAELHVSRPKAHAEALPLERIIDRSLLAPFPSA